MLPPILTLESGVFGAMGLTGSVAGIDHGEDQGTHVQIMRMATRWPRA